MLRTALTLARKGLMSSRACRGRKSRLPEHRFKDANADPKIIQAWWR